VSEKDEIIPINQEKLNDTPDYFVRWLNADGIDNTKQLNYLMEDLLKKFSVEDVRKSLRRAVVKKSKNRE
jgi:hypothetical protein